MNAEHLLDAIGLLDDDLIREAESYRRPKRNYKPWIGLAACLAVVLTLRWGLSHIGMGGGSPASGNGMSGGAAEPAASGPACSIPAGGAGSSGAEDPDRPAGEPAPAIMVDGVLYRSTGEPVPGEPDPAVIRTAASYTEGTPEEDGQSNIAPSVQYAETELGLVVLVEHEWILFAPAE